MFDLYPCSDRHCILARKPRKGMCTNGGCQHLKLNLVQTRKLLMTIAAEYVKTLPEDKTDMSNKGRHFSPWKIKDPTEHAQVKLNWDLVREIRKLREEGFSIKALSIQFNISQSQVCNITNYKQWVE